MHCLQHLRFARKTCCLSGRMLSIGVYVTRRKLNINYECVRVCLYSVYLIHTDDLDPLGGQDVLSRDSLLDDWRNRVQMLNYEKSLLPAMPSFQRPSMKRNGISSGIAYTGLGRRSAPPENSFALRKRVSALGKGMDFLGVGKRVSNVATMDFLGIGKRGADLLTSSSIDDDDATLIGDLREARRRALLRSYYSSIRAKRVFDVSPTLKKRPRGKVDLGIAYTGVGRR